MEIKPPNNPNIIDRDKKTIFLAGTIDMGHPDIPEWQKYVSELLKDDYNIYNPKRDEWDSKWEQSFENPNFYQQVMWELDSLDRCDYILMNFVKDSVSPISLLELGLYANSKKMVVVCDEFWRKGNVDIVCYRHNIPQFTNLDDAINYIKEH